MQAVIMAGGEGSRLRPLTCDRPKPMVPLVNRPVMEYAVNLLREHGITDIGVTLQYLPEEITNYFQDGQGFGVSMRYFIEESPLGTAGSVKNSGDFLKETFIVISGDALTDFNLTEVIRFHRDKKALATLVLKQVNIPLEYGVVITGEGGEIRRFLEKPGWGEVFSDTVNTGIYILEPEVLEYIPAGKKFDFSKDLFPRLLEDGRPMFGYAAAGYWCDIGNHKQYMEAHYDVLGGRVKLFETAGGGDERAARQTVGREFALGPRGLYLEHGAYVDPAALVEGPAVIGRNTRIEADARIGPYTVIGRDCHIGAGASLKRAIIWDGVHVGRKAEIRGAVLCNRVQVRAGAAIFEGAVIGDATVLEERCRVKPDTKIWPHKQVDKGALVDRHLIWGARGQKNLFGRQGITGRVDVDLLPECAARLGAVFGSVTGARNRVVLSSDHYKACKMIKQAMAAGLLAAGAEVADLGYVVTPVHRFALRAAEAQGGVHIKLSSHDPEQVTLHFFDENGATVSGDTERKMENLYYRDDFRRSARREVGRTVFLPNMADTYLAHLLGKVDRDAISHHRPRIVAAYDAYNLAGVIPPLFDRLGCDVIPLAGDFEVSREPESFDRLEEQTAAMGKFMAEEQALMGVMLDNNAESMILVDERGRVIRDEMLLGLMALLILRQGRGKTVAAPVTAPGVLETMAEQYGGSIIRTQTSSRAFQQAAMDAGVMAGQGRLAQFTLAFDAPATMAGVLDYMVRERLPLSEIVNAIPEFHQTHKTIDCPWEEKGRVMRHLIQENKNGHVDLIDGIKIYHEDGWALVLPDVEEPAYHVYTEGSKYEIAESLADFYVEKIRSIKGNQSDIEKPMV